MSGQPTIGDLAGESPSPVERYRVARAFLQCGRFSWSEWSALPVEDRAAAALAGEHLERVRAVMAGNASRGKIEAAAILQPVDGGDALEQEVMADVSAR